MSSSQPTPLSRRRPTRAALLVVVLVGLALVPLGRASASTIPGATQEPTQRQVVAVGASTRDGLSRLTVALPGGGDEPLAPGAFSVTVNGAPSRADAVPLLSDRTAAAVVVDASDAGAPVLQSGSSGAASFVLAMPPAARSVLVTDGASPTVVSPLQVGPAGTLRGLAGVRPGGPRRTGAALDLATTQLPPEPDAPRLVALYTGAPDAMGPSVADLAARLNAAGAVLAVVSATGDGTVPPYWSAVTAATGGVAVAARGSDLITASDELAAALRGRYLLTVPAPPQLPATAAVRVDTPQGAVTAVADVPAPAPPASGGTSRGAPVVFFVVLALVLVGVIVGFRRHARRRDEEGEPDAEGAPATLWNIPDRPDPVVDRTELVAAVHAARRAGRPVAVARAGGVAGTGTTTALIEYAHGARADYDIAWWVPAADPPLVVDRLAELAEVLGVAEPGDPAPVARDRLFAELERRGRWLLVFDDAADPRQLAPSLPAGPGHVLVGSDDPDWAEHATPVTLAPFTRAESAGLLRTRRPGLSAGEADRIAAAVDDLPLAVDVAGATLADTGTSVSTYLRHLAEQGRPGEPPRPGPAACAVAVGRLAADNTSALALLTMVAWLGPEPVPFSLLTAHPELLPAPLAGTGDGPDRLRDLLAVVARRGLVRVDGPTVAVHQVPAELLVAGGSADRSADGGGSPEWAAAAVRLLRAELPADPADPAGRATWRALLPHVLTTTDPGRRLDDVRVDVAWLLHHAARHLRERGDPRTARTLFDDAHDLYRTQLGPDHPDTVAAARDAAAARR